MSEERADATTAAVCTGDGRCSMIHVRDVLCSAVDCRRKGLRLLNLAMHPLGADAEYWLWCWWCVERQSVFYVCCTSVMALQQAVRIRCACFVADFKIGPDLLV